MLFSSATKHIKLWSLLIWSSVILFVFMIVLFPYQANNSIFYQINNLSIPLLEPFWVVTTNFGDGFFLFPLALLLFINRMNKALSIIYTIIIGSILLNSAKAYLNILRPAGVLGTELINVIGPVLKKQATPSGHAGTVFLLLGLTMIYFQGHVRWLILILATSTSISRIVVGAHWPFDIAFGAWIGIFSAVIGSYLAEKISCSVKSRLFIHCLSLLCVGVLPFYDNGFTRFSYILYLQYILAIMAMILTIADLYRLLLLRC